MSQVVVVGVDDSELSWRAVRAGLEVIDPDLNRVLVTVIEIPDPTLVTGTGMAGGTMSADEYREFEDERHTTASRHLEEAAAAIGIAGARTVVVEGRPGPAICELAEAEAADAIVIGSRGRSGFKRAVLGSVSDHVVRHAPCPVVVAHVEADGD